MKPNRRYFHVIAGADETIQKYRGILDCFVATLLAMTLSLNQSVLAVS